MKKIIIVDDDPVITGRVGKMFEREGYKVLTASDGAEGLKLIESEMPDLVIMDLVMPVMNGVNAIKKLKSDKNLRLIPVIVLSGIRDLSTIVQLRKLGIMAYIGKPHQWDDLLLRSKKAMGEIKEEIIPEKKSPGKKKDKDQLVMGEMISFTLVDVNDLKPDMVLATDLRNKANQVLLAHGTVITESIIKKLERMGISKVEIQAE
ncbi:MAG: response regulator [Spirochaetes bacterium]|nr:response regulator [Spirochaetota bacterium]